MTQSPMSLDAFKAMAGEASHLSRWFIVDQTRIDAFADVTEDRQFIHVDPQQAVATPFGGTIAHGFLSLSLLSAMFYDAVPPVEGEGMSLNYGFDKIRFLSPVPSGDRVRGRFALNLLEEKAPGQWQAYWDVVVEIEHGAKPALIARWITRKSISEPVVHWGADAGAAGED
ncbi:MAG: MaoC family dehydratase [Pseudomonadota bacterium]|jgi:acyl dehydratase